MHWVRGANRNLPLRWRVNKPEVRYVPPTAEAVGLGPGIAESYARRENLRCDRRDGGLDRGVPGALKKTLRDSPGSANRAVGEFEGRIRYLVGTVAMVCKMRLAIL